MRECIKMPSDARNWFVVATQPNRENVATAHLLNQGFEVFLPARRSTLRRNRRLETGRSPLFPGYLFVSFDGSPASVRSINGTRGVKYLLLSGKSPSPLPDGFVDTLLANLHDDGTVSHRLVMNPGDRIQIASGPLVHQIGELLNMDERGRVKVLLELLSGKVAVATEAANLLPA